MEVSYFNHFFQEHEKLCLMQRQQLDCGETLVISEASISFLSHSENQNKWIFSYTACVSPVLCYQFGITAETKLCITYTEIPVLGLLLV